MQSLNQIYDWLYLCIFSESPVIQGVSMRSSQSENSNYEPRYKQKCSFEGKSGNRSYGPPNMATEIKFVAFFSYVTTHKFLWTLRN